MWKKIDPNTGIKKQVTCEELTAYTGFEHRLDGNEFPVIGLRGTIIQIHQNSYKIIWSKLAKDEPCQEMKSLLRDNNFVLKEDNNNNEKRILLEPLEDAMVGYKELLELLAYTDKVSALKDPTPEFYRDQIGDKRGKFYSSAKAIKVLIENNLGFVIRTNHRNVLNADNQKAIVRGEQLNLTGKKWGEHVVPCAYIARKAAEMASSKKTEEIESYIRKHLVIINISEEQAKIIDNELGFKDTMPNRWDCIYERLHLAEIQFRGWDGERLCKCDSK